MLNSPVNGKIQGLFKAFVCYSSSFQGKLNFQGLFKSPVYLSTLQACADPGIVSREGLDEPMQWHSLTRAFAGTF